LRTLLEKAVRHLLNGDEDKAAALFHKFMVERARQIHESLRESDNADESLDEHWDSEIQEEEYFGDDDLENDDQQPAMDGTDSPIDGDMGADTGGGDDFAPEGDDGLGGEDDGLGGDVEGDLGDDDFAADGEGSEPGIEGKIDDLTDKIDDLTAEFDRVMAEFHNDGDDDGMGDDGLGDDDGFGDDDTSTDAAPDFGGGDEAAEPEDNNLAGRMENDMADDEEQEPVAEGELPDFLKKKKEEDGEDDDKEEVDEEDDLTDITESVLAELDKIAPPGNTEHKGVGSSSVKNNITNASNKDSPVPHHNVMDRVKGEPVFTKGPTHKGFARETPPTVDGADKLVQNVRPANRRKSFKDTMAPVDVKGDAGALLNKDFAPGMPKSTKSIIDGKPSKG
jgi:hypothetical protein